MSFFIQISWKELLLGSEDWAFLPETVLRTVVMFTVILVGLTILGKRGIRQLSVFELVVIIGLGSAAGDPMFYKDVGFLPALCVFIVIIVAYHIVTYLVGRFKRFEHLIEGRPVCLIKEGRFAIDNFNKEHLAQDEFFAELRAKGVSQLGQVKQAIIEVQGEVSLFFYPDEEIKFGLPILPDVFSNFEKNPEAGTIYSCSHCGYTTKIEKSGRNECPACQKDTWVKSVNEKRWK